MVSFKANVKSKSESGVMDNRSTMSYDYAPIQNDIYDSYSNQPNVSHMEVLNFVDLAITKTAAVSFVVPGGTVNYTLNVQNIGMTTATKVVVTDNIPATISNAKYSLNNGTTWNTWMGSLNIGTLPAGMTKNILLRGSVATNIAGTLINTASVRSAEPDMNPNNNMSTANVSVGKLGLAKTSSVTTTKVGDTYTYTLSITNPNSAAATNIVVTDALPSNLTYVGNLRQDGAAIPGNITKGVTVATIPAGKTVTLTFDVQVASEPTNGQIANNFTTVYASETQTSPTNIIAVELDHPAISIAKVASLNPVRVGVPYNYTITVTNRGNAILNNVRVTDVFLGNVCILRTWVNGKRVKCNFQDGVNIGTLAIGASAVIVAEVVLKDMFPPYANLPEPICGCNECEPVSMEGMPEPIMSQSAILPPVFTNIATVQGVAYVGTTPISVTDTASSTVNVTMINPSISINKSVDKNHLSVGEKATFTIQVMNTGDVSLNNVMVIDKLPCEMELICGSARINGIPGHRLDIEKGINIGTLAPNQMAYITFQVRVCCSCKYYLKNKAVVLYDYMGQMKCKPNKAKSNSVIIKICKCEKVKNRLK